MMLDESERNGERHGVVTRIAAQLRVGTQSLYERVEQAGSDGGPRSDAGTAGQPTNHALEKEKRELQQANEILKAASAFSRGNWTPAGSTEAMIPYLRLG